MELHLLTHESFAACIGQTFSVAPGDGSTVDLRLLRIDIHPDSHRRTEKVMVGDLVVPERQPFSLIFTGPLEPVLTDHCYAIRHEAFGTLDIGISPFSRSADGILYEAAFN